ncbi:DEAD/DEAH box helicase [Spiroplasma endosymbiont of Agriotes lineatus]|uniref:DEAD/DEAH box helicase n=1 Tax=Spiroplasma endosymbiont of Agriotes lineatus TaxID=3077930 RepID=UPI0030D469DF
MNFKELNLKDDNDNNINFNDLNLNNNLKRAISKIGYVNPTEIQKKTIPLVLKNYDIIGKSHTGTGKTAAFVLPILNNLDVKLRRVQAMIVCPTRELALQILDQVRKYAFYLEGVNATALFGGSDLRRQIYSLKNSNIVVGTPGRIVDHIQRRTLRLNDIQTVVLDEADEMLKMGFKQDIDKIFTSITSMYQTLLFSATMNRAVLEIANNYQNSPVKISIKRNAAELNNIKQYFINTRNTSKNQVLVNLFLKIQPNLSIVFSNTKAYTEIISKILWENGIKSAVINGDKRQSERNKAMNAFRTNKVQVLIATDVAARGIDVDGIDYIFNYDLPCEQESYVHRIGRTGRAGETGIAITLVNNKKELINIKKLEQTLNIKINPYNI